MTDQKKAPAKPKAVKKDEITPLKERVTSLEAKVKILVDAQQFIADEARPIYGLGAIGQIFDAIAKKLR